MKPRTNGAPRAQRTKSFQDQGPNWVLIAGGALFSTLSIRFGYKLKQALDAKQADSSGSDLKGSGKSVDRKRSGRRHVHSNGYSFSHDENGFNYISGTQGAGDLKQQQQQQQSSGQLLSESELAALPLVTVPEFNKECGSVLWASSPDRLEPAQKPFHQSNSSDSPCVSESGSDIFSKREVIQKLRQQLKRRDDMILEMQDQIFELQNSVAAQASHSTHMQSLLDAANRDLFDSEREIQRLRKAIADHCVAHAVVSNNEPSSLTAPSEGRNGHVHANGYTNVESVYESSSSSEKLKMRGDGDRIDMLKREVGELKEVIEGKEYLLQSYKEQKVELSTKIKELQQRLDSQLPNIL